MDEYLSMLVVNEYTKTVQYCTSGACTLANNQRCNYPKEIDIKEEDFKGNAQTKDKEEKQTLLTSMIFPNENRAVYK